MLQDDGPVGLDRVEVLFDDRRAVSDAGIVLVATLAQWGWRRLLGGSCAWGSVPGPPTLGAR
jgi:hypothetical protein